MSEQLSLDETTVLVAATAAPHKVGEESYWLTHRLEAPEGFKIQYFVALEDYRGGEINPANHLLDDLAEQIQSLGGVVWRFTFDDGVTEIDSGNRIARICMGRNMAIEYALRNNIEYILFLDTDIIVPADALSKLLAMDHPYVALNVPAYALSGPWVLKYPREWYVQEHMSTAGCWLIHKDIFRRIQFHWDPQEGLTDDPATHRDIVELLKIPLYVRHDTPAKHVPPLIRFEDRNKDRSVVKT